MDQIGALVSESLSSGAALATLSYVLLIGSMLMNRLTYLRILAIGSGIAGVVYFWGFLGDRVASFWEMLFIAANLFQLALAAYHDRMTRFDADEMLFRSAAVPGLSPSEARRLLRLGTIVSAPAGAILTREGHAVPALAFVLSGDVEIRVGGKAVAHCGHGDFIGEISVMSGEAATATAVTATPARYFAFDANAFRRLMARERVIGQEIDMTLRHGLRQKLVRANAAIADLTTPASV